jgi:hypothetical protein
LKITYKEITVARKAIVDRNVVLQLLKEGKTSQSIASQFGVSRQAIDLYRKEFVHAGLLQGSAAPLPSITTFPAATLPVSPEPAPAITLHDVSLDQMIDLMIKAFDALKHEPELEAEVTKYRRDYESLLKKIEQLEEGEKKRKEQETRWIQSQNPDNIKP